MNLSGNLKHLIMAAIIGISAVTIISCGSSSFEEGGSSSIEEESQKALWGSVHLVGEVDSADITIYQNNTEMRSVICNDGTFHNTLDNITEGAVRAVAGNVITEGIVRVQKLSAFVPSYSPGDHIDINLYTTLVDRYMQNYGADFNDSEMAVKTYLNIPENVNVSEYAYNRYIQSYFSPERFKEYGEVNGGIDTYLDTVTANIYAGGSNHHNLNSMYMGGSSESFYEDLAITAAKSASSALGNKTAGYILSTFHEGTEASNDDILNKLDEQNAKLDEISSTLDHITGMLTSLQKALDHAVEDILFAESDSKVEQAIGYIKARMSDLNTLYDTSELNNPIPIDAHANGIKMIGINASVQNDVVSMVNELHDAVMPEIASLKPGALGRYALSIQGSEKGLLDKYKAYEAYFSQILSYQYRGLMLITEAINVLQEGDAQLVQFTTLGPYKKRFQVFIDEEIDEFLRWVDYLVMSNADYSTDIANPVQFLADNSALVYKRADFIAQQFSAKHPQGLVIRLFGQPSEIQNFMNSESYQIVQIHDGWPMDWAYNVNKISSNDYDLKSSEYYETSPPEWSKSYIEWIDSNDSDGYSDGYSTSQVSSAKLVLDLTQPLQEPIYYPDYSNDETSWSLVSESQWFDNGAKWQGYFNDTLGWYNLSLNDDGIYEYKKVRSSTTGASEYGFVLYQVRHVPSKKLITSDIEISKNPSANNSVSASFDSDSLKTSYSTDINNVPYKAKSNYANGSSWTTYRFEEKHSASNDFGLNFNLHKQDGENWSLGIKATVQARYDGTNWNTHTGVILWLKDVPYLRFPYIYPLANVSPKKGSYSFDSGEMDFPLVCTPLPCSETEQSIQFYAGFDGKIDKTYESKPKSPTYTEEGTIRIEQMLFKLN